MEVTSYIFFLQQTAYNCISWTEMNVARRSLVRKHQKLRPRGRQNVKRNSYLLHQHSIISFSSHGCVCQTQVSPQPIACEITLATGSFSTYIDRSIQMPRRQCFQRATHCRDCSSFVRFLKISKFRPTRQKKPASTDSTEINMLVPNTHI